MLRFGYLILVLLVFPGIAFAQGKASGTCPDISVTGPAGVVAAGEEGSFTVSVGDVDPNSELKLKWTVTGGEIVSAVNERTIWVKVGDKISVIATIEISGLPAGCPTTFSETLPYCPPGPTAEMIGQVTSMDAKAIRKESDRVITETNDLLEDDQLYIMLGGENGATEKDSQRLEKLVIEAISGPSGRRLIHETRITLVQCGVGNHPVEFWRVPIGAENPPCGSLNAGFSALETQKGVKCPVVTVTGPPGKVHPGSEIVFTANVSGTDLDKLVFRWITTGGAIVGGQGTPSIRVTTTQGDNGKTLTAYLSVFGLPDSCSRTSEGEAVVQGGGDPPLIDEFGTLSDRDLKQKLKGVATELKTNWPNYQLYIISYTKPAEKEVVRTRREQRMRQILIQNRVSPTKISFVYGGSSSKVSTQFYAVPPGT